MDCPKCGYDRMDLSDPCPRCGHHGDAAYVQPVVEIPSLMTIAGSVEELRVAADYLSLRGYLRIQSFPLVIMPLIPMIFFLSMLLRSGNNMMLASVLTVLAIPIIIGIVSWLYPTPFTIVINAGIGCIYIPAFILFFIFGVPALSAMFTPVTICIAIVVFAGAVVYTMRAAIHEYRHFHDFSPQRLNKALIAQLDDHIEQHLKTEYDSPDLIKFTCGGWSDTDVWHVQRTGAFLLFTCHSIKFFSLLSQVHLVPVTGITLSDDGESFFDEKHKVTIQFEGEYLNALISQEHLKRLRQWQSGDKWASSS